MEGLLTPTKGRDKKKEKRKSEYLKKEGRTGAGGRSVGEVAGQEGWWVCGPTR